MSIPPPPGSPPPTPPGYGQQPPGSPQQPPPGYAAYGTPTNQVKQGTAGMAIASLVLSLVGLVPCFWGLQIPGLLGVIFGLVGMSQTKNGARGGRGLAIAGLVIGIILLLACAAFWSYVLASGDCEFDGGQLRCVN
jgi:hypothetical protein